MEISKYIAEFNKLFSENAYFSKQASVLFYVRKYLREKDLGTELAQFLQAD